MNQREYQEYLYRVTAIEEGGLSNILADESLCPLFKQYLDEEKSSEHLLFWLEAELFKSIEDPAQLKIRAYQIFKKYFTESSQYEVNINSNLMKNIKKKMEKDDIDALMFSQAQSSIFGLLEMDSLPRFLNSENYIKYRGTQMLFAAYCVRKAKHPSKGIKMTYRQRESLSFPECFVATEFVSWMIQRLYLLDRRSGIELGIMLQARGFIECLCGVELEPESEPKKEKFADNDSYWRFTERPVDTTQNQRKLKTIEELVSSMKYKTSDRKSFETVVEGLTTYLMKNLELLSTIVSSSWAIPRSERDGISLAIVKLCYTNGCILPLIRNILEGDFQKPELGTLLYGEKSFINKIMDSYFQLTGREYIKIVLTPLFSKNFFERDLCFDLKNEKEDQALNQTEFIRVISLILDSAFSIANLDKIPKDIRQIARYISELSRRYDQNNVITLLGGFLLRTINKALMQPDEFDVIPSPWIPLPRVKENLFLVTRFIENLITGEAFKRGYLYMAFANRYIEAKRMKEMKEFLENFCLVPKISSASQIIPSRLITMTFANYASLVTTLYNNKDKLETVFTRDDNTVSTDVNSFTIGSTKSSFLTLQSVTPQSQSKPHNFEAVSLASASWCLYCGEFIWGNLNPGFCCKGRVAPNNDFLAENCKCVVHKKCMYKAPKNCGDSYYRNYTKNGNNLEMVGSFFFMLQQAYSLIIHGNEENKIKLYYSPVFSTSRTVLEFCLANNIGFELAKIDYLYGDFKEEPILVDHEFMVSDSYTIIRYLADKFCVPNSWYPSSTRSLSADNIKLQAKIEQLMEWAVLNIKEPILQIFWKEVFPRLNLNSADGQDQILIESSHRRLTESLAFLDSQLTDKQFLTSTEISIADLLIAEHLNMFQLFLGESLDPHPNVGSWFFRVRDQIPFWNEVNLEFNSFVQTVMCIASNDGISSIQYDLLFTAPVETIWRKFTDILGFQMDLKKLTKDEQGLVPERVVIQNYKSEHIPDYHFSVLQLKFKGTPERIPTTKLSFNLINPPINKTKSIMDDWLKVFKQFNCIQVTDYVFVIYLPFPQVEVWDLLLNQSKLSAITKTSCVIVPKAAEKFSLLDGSITGTMAELHTYDSIVQRWRLSDWPENHFSTLRYTIEHYTVGETQGSKLNITHTNIPIDKLKDVEAKQRDFWKKIKGEFVVTLEQEVYFQETVPQELYKMFQKTATETPAFKFHNRMDSDGGSSITIKRCCRSDEWPHATNLTISFTQMGDRDVRTKKAVRLVLFQENIPKAKVKALAEVWEKNFWKKMKGVLVTTIQQSIIFNYVSPSEVYENLLNLSKFSKKKCTLTSSTEMGDEFTLYDGMIQGRVHKLMKNRLICHKWRVVDWPEGHYCEVKFVLQELAQEGKERSITTKIFLRQEGVPVRNEEGCLKFWTKFWKAFKDQKGEISIGVNARRESKGFAKGIEKTMDIGKRMTERRT